MTTNFQLRVATDEDIPAIQDLIAVSVRGLSPGHYNVAQVETAIAHVFGVDTQLIRDRTYYVVESVREGERALAAAGGWSSRKTLFGGDHMKTTADELLDPSAEPARIRAFFVHPDMTRRGLARMVFGECELAAQAGGFREFVLIATLPGRLLYHALGFCDVEAFELPMPGGVTLPLVRMSRPIAAKF
ncbi:MAG: GNAT family N-acetyltransferase [Phycisphaerae bacterium]|nr:GNAT family N-acetyltransferase [Gemmatimonadaceae bacterium]